MSDQRYGTRALADLCNVRTYQDIGSAIYLLGFLRSDQFHRRNPVTYDWLADRTGFNTRTLETWLRKLRRMGHCRVDSGWNGLHVALRVRFAAVATESDYELIDTRGWQRPLESDNVEREFYGNRGGGDETRHAFADRNPMFIVEGANGERQSESLSDSAPPDIPARRRHPVAMAAD
jgi:hypothetical protein